MQSSRISRDSRRGGRKRQPGRRTRPRQKLLAPGESGNFVKCRRWPRCIVYRLLSRVSHASACQGGAHIYATINMITSRGGSGRLAWPSPTAAVFIPCLLIVAACVLISTCPHCDGRSRAGNSLSAISGRGGNIFPVKTASQWPCTNN